MPATQTGIEYEISGKGSASNPTERREKWSPGSNQTYEVVRVAWGDWDQFTVDMLGNGGWIPNGSGGFKLSRNLPESHPLYPWLIATDIELLEIPAATGTAWAGLASIGDFDEDVMVLAGVTYSSVLYEVADDATAWAQGELARYVERPFRFAIQNLTLIGYQLQFLDQAGTSPAKGIIGANPVLLYPSSDRMYVWKRVPAASNGLLPPKLLANIANTMGRINSDTFDGIPPYTLLCGAPEVEQMVGPLGNIEFTIKYPLSEQPSRGPATQPWNSKYRLTNAAGNLLNPDGSSAAGFYDVHIANSNGVRPYSSAPFAKLFQNA